MTKKLSLLLLVAVLIAVSCSSRRTRQFIAEDPPDNSLQAGQWVIDLPSVIAFKDIVNLDKIADTTMFWVSMRAKKLRGLSQDDLSIDSIKVSFLPGEEYYWRYPTRMAPYDAKGDKYVRKTFEFFGDQGIVIPIGVDQIFLEFEAVTSDIKHPFKLKMVRDEKAAKVPLLRQ